MISSNVLVFKITSPRRFLRNSWTETQILIIFTCPYSICFVLRIKKSVLLTLMEIISTHLLLCMSEDIFSIRRQGYYIVQSGNMALMAKLPMVGKSQFARGNKRIKCNHVVVSRPFEVFQLYDWQLLSSLNCYLCGPRWNIGFCSLDVLFYCSIIFNSSAWLKACVFFVMGRVFEVFRRNFSLLWLWFIFLVDSWLHFCSLSSRSAWAHCFIVATLVV